MKRFRIFTGLSAVFIFLIVGSTHGQGLLLNEVEFDAPNDANESCQYVEVRGTPGATVPAGVQFISVNGDSGSFGDILQPTSLGGRVVGANGTITIINDVELCDGRTFPAGTTQVFTTSFSGLGLGAETYMLISSPNTFSEGDDIDANNDRVIDPSAQITVIDGFGVTINVDFQATYAPNIYDAVTKGGGSIELPDAATRFSNNNTPLSTAAWYFGELASTPDNTTVYSGIPRSANFPVGGALTPGGANVPTMVTPQKAVVDFNGDGRTDYSIARLTSNSVFWWSSINGSGEQRVVEWGVTGDVPVPEDFDGDGNDDIAVWRPGAFYILQSSDSTVRVEQFGVTGDDPAIAGDWDGDGKADPAVYRDGGPGQQSTFFYRGSQGNPGGAITFVPWGIGGDKVVRGDFDGDAKQDAAVYRSTDSIWYVLSSSTQTVSYTPFGLSGDTRVSGDFDGDAKTDLAVFRDGVWYVLGSTDGQVRYINWGLTGDVPVPGDYDGDGKTDAAIWRNGIFYIQNSGGSVSYFSWGTAGDNPIASVFNN